MSETEGRLEIFYRGIWGTVCDDAAPGFPSTKKRDQGDDAMANVVCRMLGRNNGGVVKVQDVFFFF